MHGCIALPNPKVRKDSTDECTANSTNFSLYNPSIQEMSNKTRVDCASSLLMAMQWVYSNTTILHWYYFKVHHLLPICWFKYSFSVKALSERYTLLYGMEDRKRDRRKQVSCIKSDVLMAQVSQACVHTHNQLPSAFQLPGLAHTPSHLPEPSTASPVESCDAYARHHQSWMQRERQDRRLCRHLQCACFCCKVKLNRCVNEYPKYIQSKYANIQYNTVQYNTVRYNTIQYNRTQHNRTQLNTVQYHVHGESMCACGCGGVTCCCLCML